MKPDKVQNNIADTDIEEKILTEEELEVVTGGITNLSGGGLRKVKMDFVVEGQGYGEQTVTN